MTTEELYELIKSDESYRIERTVSTGNMDKFQEAICAFANDLPGSRKKGYLLIGVHDDGSISGLKVDDTLMKKISGIRSDDYQSTTPTRLYQYNDRIEIMNPGGLYGNARPDNFPNVNDYRNNCLAGILKSFNYVNMFNHGIYDVQTLLEANGNGLAEFDVNLMTVFLAKVKNAETIEASCVRQQIFDNLQPNLQPELDVQVQDIEDRCKRLIIGMDIYVLSTNELLHRYLSCNQSCNHLATMSRQAFAKSVLKPAIDDGYVQMLYPDKPNHRGQKYKLTDKGLMLLRKLLSGS